MLEYDELRLRLEGLKPDIDDLAGALGLDQCRKELAELEEKAAAPNFWDDMEGAQAILQRTANLKGRVDGYAALLDAYHDTMTLIELANEEGDPSLLEECTAGVDKV